MAKQRHIVAQTWEIPPGARRIIELEGRSIGVFNVHGRYVAVLNVCPHELAPVCLGRLGGTTLPSAPGEWIWGREGEILACPWHGWAFDLTTGQNTMNPAATLVRFPCRIEDGYVVLES